MKKIISILLSVLIVFAAAPLGTLGAFAAESDYTELVLDQWTGGEIGKENYQRYSFTPAQDGVYAFYSRSDIDTTGRLYDGDMDQVAFDDDSGEGSNFMVLYGLNAGETYCLEVRTWGGVEGSFEVTVVLTDIVPATGIAFEQDEVTAYTGLTSYIAYTVSPENSLSYGLYCESSNEGIVDAYIANTVNQTVGISCGEKGETTVTLTDAIGNSTSCHVTVVDPSEIELDNTVNGNLPAKESSVAYKFTASETSYHFMHAEAESGVPLTISVYDSNDTCVDNLTSYGGSVDLKTELTAGETYYIMVSAPYSAAGDFSFFVSYAVVPIDLTIVSNPDRTEYFEGYTEDDMDYTGLQVCLTWSDGEMTYWSYGDYSEENIAALRGENMYVWLDDTGDVSVMCGDCEAIVPITTVANPVESIELSEPVTWEFTENYGGYWNTGYNYETGEEERSYIYTKPYYGDLQIIIHYTDGTSKTESVYHEVDGYSFSLTSDQYENPWHVGEDHHFTVSYMNRETYIPVVIKPNPVDHITIPGDASITLIENVNGYWTTDYMTEEEYFNYYLPDLSNIDVEIHYVDGATLTTKINADVDGEQVEYNSNQYDHHWKRDGENYVTVSYLGKETKLPVIIGDTPVSVIEINSAPTRVYMYGDNFYGGVEGFYPSDLTGLVFTVYFKDGTKKTYTDKDISKYPEAGGYEITLETAGAQRVGKNRVAFHYMGATAGYDVTVRENNVKSIAMTKLPEINSFDHHHLPDWLGAEVTVTYKDNSTKVVELTRDNLVYVLGRGVLIHTQFDIDGVTAQIIGMDTYKLFYGDLIAEIGGVTHAEGPELDKLEVEDFALTGENMLLKLYYKDGSTENIRCEELIPIEYGIPDMDLYMVRTPKGLVPVYITHAYDLPTSVSVWGVRCEIDKLVYLGDANGDGEVDIEDVTLVQRYLAEFDDVDAGWLKETCDVNRDGVINIYDVTAIQRYLADIENPYRIGSRT